MFFVNQPLFIVKYNEFSENLGELKLLLTSGMGEQPNAA